MLAKRREAGKPIGRPHLTRRCSTTPRTRSGSPREGYDDVSAFLPDFLIPGKPAYLARTHPTVIEAIGWIHEAGGVAIWAHPFWDLDTDAEVLEAIDLFREHGLDGVECFYVTHTPEQTHLLAERCDELGLLKTGSSDYHGPEHRLFSSFGAFDAHGHAADLDALLTRVAPRRLSRSAGSARGAGRRPRARRSPFRRALPTCSRSSRSASSSSAMRVVTRRLASARPAARRSAARCPRPAAARGRTGGPGGPRRRRRWRRRPRAPGVRRRRRLGRAAAAALRRRAIARHRARAHLLGRAASCGARTASPAAAAAPRCGTPSA